MSANFDSNYISIEIQMLQGKCIFLNTDDYEGNNLFDYDPRNEILNRFLAMGSIEELLDFLELEPSDFSDDITQYEFQDIRWISVSYNRMLYGKDINLQDKTLVEMIKQNITSFLMDIAEDEDREFDPDEVDWDREIMDYCDSAAALIVARTVTYFLKDRTVGISQELDTL